MTFERNIDLQIMRRSIFYIGNFPDNLGNIHLFLTQKLPSYIYLFYSKEEEKKVINMIMMKIKKIFMYI